MTHRDRGYSLMEMLVTMALLGVVMVATASLTLGIQRLDHDSVTRVNRTADARIALRAMSRHLSHAVIPTALGGSSSSAVDSAGPLDLTLYAHVDNPGGAQGPSRVEYTLVEGVLTQTVRIPRQGTWDDYCTDSDRTEACAGRVTATVLLRNVRNSTADPLFVYRDDQGTVTTAPGRIRSIDLDLRVGEIDGPTTRLVDHLTLTNL